MLTEGAGVPIGLAHDGANRNDHKMMKGTLDSIPIKRPKPTTKAPQGICLDAAYDNTQTRELIDNYDLTPHIRSRGVEIKDKAHKSPDSVPGAGSLKLPIHGSIATAASSYAGPRTTKITSPCSNSQADLSPTRKPTPHPYRHRP